MQFVNTNDRQPQNNFSVMRMASYVRPNSFTQSPQVSEQPIPQEKKMEWGEPTWFFLHTMSEKIKDSEFNTICKDFLQIIYNICTNLPCPMCSQHAKEYIQNSYFFRIKTKEELKAFLYTFHNVVNKKKSYPLFDYAKLSEKYKVASTKPIIYNFMFHFQKRNKGAKMLANDMYRGRVVNTIKQWLSTNIIYFDD